MSSMTSRAAVSKRCTATSGENDREVKKCENIEDLNRITHEGKEKNS